MSTRRDILKAAPAIAAAGALPAASLFSSLAPLAGHGHVRDLLDRAHAELLAALDAGRNIGITRGVNVWERDGEDGGVERKLGDGVELSFRVYDSELSDAEKAEGWR